MTGRAHYELSPAADADLVDIYHYTEQAFGEHQADDYLTELEQAFGMLCDNPESGRSRNDIRKGLRALVKNRHIIFYRIKTRRIHIVRVLAMAQDIHKIFK